MGKKERNTFSFKSFHERLAIIKIDVTHVVKKTSEIPEDSETFFSLGLKKWIELNCTEQFKHFTREVSPICRSFAQLVHHQQDIVDKLKKYLKIPNSLARVPLLELVVELARDLQTDFYPYFKDFFDILVNLLGTQDTELLENAFKSMSYLFKFLWRYMAKDIKNVFGFYHPLLSKQQKPHICQFAAESFAFLMRKTTDLDSLLDFMFSLLKEKPALADGLGLLFFEMIKGVKKQFHSTAGNVLKLLLSKLGPCQTGNEMPQVLPWNEVYKCLLKLMNSITFYTISEHCTVVWSSLLEEANRLSQTLSNVDSSGEYGLSVSCQLQSVLNLLNVMILGKNGSLMSQPLEIHQTISSLLLSPQVCEGTCSDSLLHVVSSLVKSTHPDLSKDRTRKPLFDKLLSGSFSQQQVFMFIRSLLMWDNFNERLLPDFVNYIQNKLIKTDDKEEFQSIVMILAEVVLDDVSDSGDGLDTMPGGTVQLLFPKISTSSGSKILQPFLDVLMDCQVNESSLEQLWAVLVVIPSIRPLVSSNKLIGAISSCISSLSQTLKTSSSLVDKTLFVLSEAVKSLIFLCQNSKQKLISFLHFDVVLENLSLYASNVHVLHASCVYLSACRQQEEMAVLGTENLEKVYPLIKDGLFSPAHLQRLLTLRVLCSFDQLKMESSKDNPFSGMDCTLFETCLKAEQVPLTLDKYREKLLYLSKLNYSPSYDVILPTFYKDVAVHYLIGMLYLNFSPLWNPVIELIKSHSGSGLVFWNVYKAQLSLAADNTEKSLTHIQPELDQARNPKPGSGKTKGMFSSNTKFFHHYFSWASKPSLDNRADYVNFRLLLWQAMASFPGVAEAKSRDVVALFLRFLQNEYFMADESVAPSQDIRNKTQSDIPTENSTNPSPNEDQEMPSVENEDEPDINDVHRKKKFRAATKSLCVHLTLFSHFRNPKALYKESELSKLYNTFLTHREPEVHKLAVKCIITYKHAYLNPYKDNLDRLLEDETFRDELTLFTQDEAESVIDSTHRQGLMQVVVRILYGKMQRLAGAGTGGKAGGAMRRSLVLRFLANCPDTEKQIFMDLILAPFKHILTEETQSFIQEEVNLSNIIPLKKQQGFLKMLSQIISRLGHLVTSFLPSLIHVLLRLLSACSLCLQSRDKIQRGCVNQLKIIRQLGISCLSELLYAFPGFDYQPFLQAIFQTAVWPQLDRLSIECVQHPTPLLKLIHTWTRVSRYFPLFHMAVPSTPGIPVLHHVFACLQNPDVSSSVVSMVMDMTENLLGLDDFEAKEGEAQLICQESSDSSNDVEMKDEKSLGTQLVLPHVAVLLRHLSKIVKNAKSSSKRVGRSPLPRKELTILSKISVFVKDCDDSTVLIRLLLPFLNYSQKPETENDTLLSIKHLLHKTTDPSVFLKPLSKLFSVLSARFSRHTLCQIMDDIGKHDGNFQQIADVTKQLNAWEAKHVEEPDYLTRLDGFTAGGKLIESGGLKPEFVLPILHNCIFVVSHTDDMSLRDSASNCISKLVNKISQCYKEEDFNELILQTLVPGIKKALKSKVESSRNEFISFLAHLIRTFDHIWFQDMKQLINSDAEVDFFANVKHIQLHRRIRALQKLEEFCVQKSLRPTTLTSYLLPLAAHCVFEHTANNEHNLLMQAVSTIGAVCSCLPWSQYHNVLKHYLKLLPRSKEMQRPLIRVVVAILNNFHFDLSVLTTEVLLAQEENKGEVQKTQLPKDSKNAQENKSVKTEEIVEQKVKADEQNENADEQKENADEQNENADEQDEEADEEEEEEEEEKPVNKDVIKQALHINNVVTSRILPQLYKVLTKKSKSESFHRLSGQKDDEEQQVLRVPIALAMVKLLQCLPQHTLHGQLPGLLLRVCQTLKSRAKEVRDTAKDTLAKITVSLGCNYLPFALTELRNTLTRGYQLHVLGHTVFRILDSLLPTLQPGDFDPCLQSLAQILVEDLFGEPANERDVEKIGNKLHEAKSTKSFTIVEIIGKFVTPKSLTTLMTPLKEVLDNDQTHKVKHRVEEVLRRLGVGLQVNSSFTPENLLIFIHGLTTESMPMLKPQSKVKKTTEEAAPDPRLKLENHYLVPSEPGRGGKVPEINVKTNAHILVEFGLHLLFMSFKRQKFSLTKQEHIQMLDPFASLLTNCLTSKHTKISTLSLRTICWLIKYPLPSLESHVPMIAKQLFILLKTFARTGAATSGENYEMVLSAFKTMTVVIRDFKQFEITKKHLQVLLSFVVEDINDYSRQGTAFPLLKAILSRKLMVPEIYDVISKVEQLVVRGSSPSVQLQCRQISLQFMLDYPLGKKLQKHLEFFVSQLEYESESGRESVLEMMAAIFTSFPQDLLHEYAGFFFVPLSTLLVNDESANCRRLTAASLKVLLQNVDVSKRDQLFSIVKGWLTQEKVSHQRLAAQLCGIFVDTEEKSFDRRLSDILPALSSVILPINYDMEEDSEPENQNQIEKIKDHLLFNSLSTLAKIFKECHVLDVNAKQQELTAIWASVSEHLLHGHSWVRLVSSRLFGLLFSTMTPETLASDEEPNNSYLRVDKHHKLSSLTKDMCTQLESPYLSSELGEQAVKNLVFLAKTIALVDMQNTENDQDDEIADLTWLLDRMSNIAKQEASETPKITKRRLCVQRWIAAVSLGFKIQQLNDFLPKLLEPVHREIDLPTSFKDPELQRLAGEVAELIKGIVGKELFSRAYINVQRSAMDTRENRKKQKALEAVSDPAKTARKKLKRNLAKKDSRKRKFDVYKGRKIKKPRMEDGISQ